MSHPVFQIKHYHHYAINGIAINILLNATLMHYVQHVCVKPGVEC